MILSVFIKAFDIMFRPKLKPLNDKEKSYFAKTQKNMSIYQFENCPYCVKVRWEMRRLGLSEIVFKDAKNNSVAKAELLSGGGKVQVPCLRIEKEKGVSTWLYESSEIIEYLRKTFS